MNTRIQVEHPITEELTGMDLVKAQIRIAAGERLNIRQREVHLRGHAIECRINAEDPAARFIPSAGKVKRLYMPGGPGIRVDTHLYSGYTIPHYYDSLLAKIIAYGDTRTEAIARMKRALRECIIRGVKTTIPFQLQILEDQRFVNGSYSTDLVKQLLGIE